MIKNTKNQVEIKFGTGDIGFNSGACDVDDKKVGIITFYNQAPRKIGLTGDIPVGVEVDIKDFPVVMTFYKKESIDALIKSLLTAKKEMK